MNPEEKVRAAIRLQNDPLFITMLDELRMDAYREWSTSAPQDDETRAVAYHKHTALIQLQMDVQNLAAKA